MKAQNRQKLNDSDLIARYTTQPAMLPVALRSQIESQIDGQPVQLYALADLDQSMQLSEIWVVLSPDYLVIAQSIDDGDHYDFKIINRDSISTVYEIPGLSCSSLVIDGTPGDMRLATLRYFYGFPALYRDVFPAD